jgi:4-hydroxy-4-methyl-2-oxoglutarate aldolase
MNRQHVRLSPAQLVQIRRRSSQHNQPVTEEHTLTDSLSHLLNAGTAVISDVFDSIGRIPLVLDTNLKPANSPVTRFAGPAYTIEGHAEKWTSGGDRAKLAAIDAMPDGVVALWSSMDARGVCCFGDLLATAMQARGCAGTVVDGGVRDVAFLKSCSMPVVARYLTPAQAIGRWRVTASQLPVQVRGALQDWITVEPGDIVVSDEDGVIIVPAALLTKVINQINEWASVETESRDAIKAGMPLLAALEKYGHL